MSYHMPDIAQSPSPTIAGGEHLFTPLAYYSESPQLDISVQQVEPGLGVLPYVQPPLSIPPRSPMFYHLNPFNLPEDLDGTSPNACHYTPTSVVTPAFGREYHLPQVPIYLSDIFPATAAGIDTLNTCSAAPSNGRRSMVSSLPLMSIPTCSSDSASYSSTQNLTAPGTGLPTAAGAPGPSIAMALEEITVPPENPVFSFCDFGTALTLGNALKRNFSSIAGDSVRRAFPSRDFAAKLAFWLKFRLGNDFHPRRKQVTVVTTKKPVIVQPSKSRLAYLVAREMERYLKECELRKRPFPYTLDEIILRRIDLVSKGTIRPRLYVRSCRPRSIRSVSVATC